MIANISKCVGVSIPSDFYGKTLSSSTSIFHASPICERLWEVSHLGAIRLDVQERAGNMTFTLKQYISHKW